MQKATLLKNLLFLSIITLLLSACSASNARRKKTLFNSPTDNVTDTIKHVYVVNDQGLGDIYYRIKVNDVIAVRNLQNREFGAVGTASSVSPGAGDSNMITYPVDNDGTVNLPAIGRVSIVGLTRKEATIKLQQIYEKDQLKKPIIEVSIVNVKVTLLGEFSSQGNYLLERDNTNLIEIIGQAGGITKDADPKTLKIIRGDKSRPETIYVNLNDINSLASKKLILQNNDIIVIQPTKNIVLSQKLQSFNNIVQPLLVVINLAVLIFTFTR
ncbi:polysaccharide biosynthesis/export family protein [Pedobacter sp. Hv1]|uniref:polysaccharide biosynthesis/export family protein n=1 Tax=Pedobacter sp. Hv1 TaxID=1740090 RepID=UPI0006D88D3A|nr:polysaccharide biosynthesis/export family protein [Pedobacter sp. Hv1]KQC02413.1 hypothetical protein AQF98_02205 [Pedobacter sp. Hv1]